MTTNAMSTLVVPVILCGGSGTRLWPASRDQHPKQFLNLMGENSLLQETALRALRTTNAVLDNVVTVTLGSLSHQVAEQLSALEGRASQHILSEPSARNTAAAVAYAASYIEALWGPDALMLVLPADHHIGNEAALSAAFTQGIAAAAEGYLVTFGIEPTRPDTGYGYIRLGDELSLKSVHQAAAFVEKPKLDVAKAYVESGEYLWNSGMFLFKAGQVLSQFQTHAPHILEAVREAMIAGQKGAPDSALYAAIPSEPFDKAIMEKTPSVAVIPCNPAWSDIGSWESLWDIREKDAASNVIEGAPVLVDSTGCLVISKSDRLVACAGVSNLVVIDTGDTIFIGDRSNSDSLKALVAALKKSGYPQVSVPPADHARRQVSAQIEALKTLVSADGE